MLTTLPDTAAAQKIAAQIVERRLAACVNVLAPCRSVYRWQGKVEQAEEVPLLIKTAAETYAALEAFIRAHHPYELPEIVAVRSDRGLPEFLAWVAAEAATASGEPSATGTPPC